MTWTRNECEFIASQAKSRFDQVKMTWIDLGSWVMPHRTRWLTAQVPGARNNHHIVDPTHILAHRSYVAGMLEGNTSAGRPWYRHEAEDPNANDNEAAQFWNDAFNRATRSAFARSNFYDAAARAYGDIGAGFNTAAYWVDELPGPRLYFHNLMPGSYFPVNDAFGEAIMLVREWTMSVKALVERYGRTNADGTIDWSNISDSVKRMYETADYGQMIDLRQVTGKNKYFDPSQPVGGENRPWVAMTYEMGTNRAQYQTGSETFGDLIEDRGYKDKWLEVDYRKRKPFIVPKNTLNANFEYGEDGPTTHAISAIKSLNKKAIAKDMALEQMLKPAMQGPSTLRKNYLTTASNSYLPLDANALAQGGVKPVNQIRGEGINAVIGDVMDLRTLVERCYYADYLLYLSRNPKTRTATETNAIVQEQQLIIGPMLQALNWTHNIPVVEYVMDFVLDEDPYLPEPPPELGGQFMKIEFVSVFAQAQKAADLPSIRQYIESIMGVAQIDPKVLQKVNTDKIADILEDRLFLPAGINNPQEKVDALREQAAKQMERKQMLQETLPAVAGAGLDIAKAQQTQAQGAAV